MLPSARPGWFNIPNLLSLMRLAGTPFLFLLVGLPSPAWFLVGYVFLGLTDFLDGYLARALNQTSHLGSVLDTVADIAYYLSTAWFLWVLFPEYIRPNFPWLALSLGLLAAVILYTWIRFNRVLIPHTHLGRTAGPLVVVGMLLSFQGDTTRFFLLIITLYGAAFLEMLLMFHLYGEVDLDTRTILWLKRGRPKASESGAPWRKPAQSSTRKP
jgi:phosphatidylglycerophosphate synthase